MKLVDLPQKIDVQFTLKHIPKLKNKAIHIDLPNSMHFDSREVCLFVKDLDKKNREYEPTVQHFEDILKKEKVTSISKIVPLKALRTDYSLPSSKVSLAKSYDLFLADACVMGLLPGLLGKVFYAKKKTVPVKVNMGVKPLKKEIDKAVNNTRCILQGSGSSCLVTVAHDRQSKAEIVSNILAACTQLAERLPGGQQNIRNIYIKGPDTAAIPVYIDLESANKVKLLEVKPTVVETCTDDITTVLGGKMVVRADGLVRYIRDAPVEVKGEKPQDEEEDDDRDEDDYSSGESDAEASDEEASDEEEETKDNVKARIQELKSKTKKRKSVEKKEINEDVSERKKLKPDRKANKEQDQVVKEIGQKEKGVGKTDNVKSSKKVVGVDTKGETNLNKKGNTAEKAKNIQKVGKKARKL